MDESPVKAEGASVRYRAGYKSWKKKYRKMRIVFDQKMHDGEELHKQEDKAAALVKRLAVENDRLLDLLLEINHTPQVPSEKKILLQMPPPKDPEGVKLPGDDWNREKEGRTSLQVLLRETPHLSYEKAKEALPSIVADLKASDGEAYPADFLTPDDVDNYTHDIDTHLDPESHNPTLAPRAHPTAHQPSNPHLKNPTSVTNWLRKHAPKVFLQDGETHDAEDGDGGHHTGGRKTRGGRGERGGRASTRGKRASAAARTLVEKTDVDVSMDDDAEFAQATPVGRGKRKRGDTDDAGYKPRGSSTRPTKKKRKSEAADGTPSARKSKKESAAARDD